MSVGFKATSKQTKTLSAAYYNICFPTYKQMRTTVKWVYPVGVPSSQLLYYIVLKEDNSPFTQFYL